MTAGAPRLRAVVAEGHPHSVCAPVRRRTAGQRVTARLHRLPSSCSERRGRGAAVRSLSGRSPRGAPLLGGGRSSKSPLPRPLLPPEARDTETVLCCIVVPRISMRSPSRPRCSAVLEPTTEVTRMPSRSNSASARRTMPGTHQRATGRRRRPRAARALLGARHVQVPSSRLLVSSMSILRPMPSDNATNDGGEDIRDRVRSGFRPDPCRNEPPSVPPLVTPFLLPVYHLLLAGGPPSGGRVRQGSRCPYPGTVAGGTLRLDTGARLEAARFGRSVLRATAGAQCRAEGEERWTTTAAPETVSSTPPERSRPRLAGASGHLTLAMHMPGRANLAARRLAIFGTPAALPRRSHCSEQAGARAGGRGGGQDRRAERVPRSQEGPVRAS